MTRIRLMLAILFVLPIGLVLSRSDTKNIEKFGFQIDENQVLWGGRVLDGAEPSTFQIVSPSPSSVAVFSKDESNVFLNWASIRGADPDSFQVIEGAFSRDRNRVYCGTTPIFQADPDTFEVVLNYGTISCEPSLAELHFGKRFDAGIFAMSYSKDRHAYYYGPVKVPDADYETFHVCNEREANDKFGEFYGFRRKKDEEAAISAWKKKYGVIGN